MDEIAINLKNRKDILAWIPLTADYSKMVKEIEQKYPGFKAKDQEFNPNRVRWMKEADHYEFYLERE